MTGTPATSAPSVSPTPEDSLDWSARTDIAAGPSAREDHTWTVAADGITAYLFGGRTAEGASDEIWQFDLAADSWSILSPTGARPDARWGHTATWVDGVGLVVWSGQNERGFFDDIWRYQPSVGLWEELPSMGEVPQARYGSCASLGPDGRLWISHGFTEDAGRFSDTRAYDFTTGEWTDETPDGEVPVERCLHDCYWSAGGRLILYGGQTTGTPALGDLWVLDPASGWQRAPEPGAPARQLYALATTESGAVVFGGGSADGGFLDDTWLIADATLEVVEQPYQTRPEVRSGATLIPAGDFRYLLFGGRSDDGLRADLWELSGFFSTHP